jgi:hypothetical protein
MVRKSDGKPLKSTITQFALIKIALIINEKRGSKEKFFSFVIRRIPRRPVRILEI